METQQHKQYTKHPNKNNKYKQKQQNNNKHSFKIKPKLKHDIYIMKIQQTQIKKKKTTT